MSAPRFLTIDQVAEELATSHAQVYALLKRGELVGIKIGGRGQWRVERAKLEEYIARAYEDTAQWLRENPDAADRELSPGTDDGSPGPEVPSPAPDQR